MLKIKISPSILAADFAHLGDAVQKLEASGADYIHCDVMDGNFVSKITFGDQMVKSLRSCTELPLDCHLMVLHPERRIEEFAAAGADIITAHYEAQPDLASFLRAVKSLGIKAGAVINPDTPVEKLFPVAEEADMLLMMSVFPGLGGQKFIPESLKRIEALRNYCVKCGKPDMDIEVDGGVGEGNIKEVLSAGANVIVAGSAVFRSADMRATIAKLRGE